MVSHSDARIDACDMADYFIDEIVEQLVESGEASDDINNDYPNGDSYHHESHVDKAYNLKDAAEILDVFSEHEETDSGLWEGQAPRDAISTQAAFTYGAAVASEWHDLIEKINEVPSDLEDELEAIDDELLVKSKRFDELTDHDRELTADEETELASLDNFAEEATAKKTKIIKAAVKEAIEEYKE